MIPYWRPLGVAASAALVYGWARLDCDPGLYWYERYWFHDNALAKQEYYRDKSIWIVGASSGIGRELALQLSQLPCRRLILTSRNHDKLQQVVNDCQRKARDTTDNNHNKNETVGCCECWALPLDVTNHSQLQEAVQQLHEPLDGPPWLDMVIFNAGVGQLCPALETPPHQVEQLFQRNALWPMILLPLLLQRRQQSPPFEPHDSAVSSTPTTTTTTTSYTEPSKPNHKSPHIVVTSSVGATLPLPLSATYAATKAALQQYLQTLATERPDLSITVLCPGTVDTPFHHSKHSVTATNDPNATVATTTTTTNASFQTTIHDTTQPNNPTKAPTTQPTSPLKMSVQRCARLYLAAVAHHNNGGGGFREHVIAQQPTLTAVHLHRWFPTLSRWILARIGTKRIQLWRQGKDLYDPASWTNRPHQN